MLVCIGLSGSTLGWIFVSSLNSRLNFRLKSSVEIYTDVCLAHTNTLEIQDRMFRKNPIFARLKWSRSAWLNIAIESKNLQKYSRHCFNKVLVSDFRCTMLFFIRVWYWTNQVGRSISYGAFCTRSFKVQRLETEVKLYNDDSGERKTKTLLAETHRHD